MYGESTILSLGPTLQTRRKGRKQKRTNATRSFTPNISDLAQRKLTLIY